MGQTGLQALALMAAAAGGGDAPDEDDGTLYLWPECEPAWQAFEALRDQWREGSLPRSEILAHLGAVITDPAERRDVYHDVCACAMAARDVVLAHRAAKRKEAEEEARARQRRR